MLLVMLVALCGVAFARSHDQSAIVSGGPLRAFTAGSLERIRPGDAARPLEPAKLWAARGESESFQVAVRGPARGVTAEMGTLIGPGGARIGAEHVKLYREAAVRVEHSTSYYGGPNPPEAPVRSPTP